MKELTRATIEIFISFKTFLYDSFSKEIITQNEKGDGVEPAADAVDDVETEECLEVNEINGF